MWRCEIRTDTCDKTATDTHWNWPFEFAGEMNAVDVLAVCGGCVSHSKAIDSEFLHAQFLYLPIVQPVMGSEQALAMEAAPFAVGRLLLLTPEDRALLQAAQDAAWERVHGRAA